MHQWQIKQDKAPSRVPFHAGAHHIVGAPATGNSQMLACKYVGEHVKHYAS